MTSSRTANRPWVLFDLDDTLFDYRAAEAAAVEATLRDAGLAPTPELVAAYRESNRRAWDDLERGRTTPARLRVERWARVLEGREGSGADPETVADRYIGHLAAGRSLVPGAADTVARVARTHAVGVVTNGLADVQRPRLAAAPFAQLVEVVVISEEVGAAKPEPAFFDAAFALMGGPQRSWVTLVGDSLTADVAGGVAYGLTTVWFAPDGIAPPPDGPMPSHRIRTLTELPAWLAAQPAR